MPENASPPRAQRFEWKGRHDGEQASQLRLHQIIHQTTTTAVQERARHTESNAYVLLGFCSDEGVRRNHGRIGAATAPHYIRQQLANLPVHHALQLRDDGDIYCQGQQLEQAQQALAERLTQILTQGEMPIVLGGGHELGFASFCGLFDYLQQNEPQKHMGIINFDAHFDLRQHDVATSGTPFLQAAQRCQQYQQDFHYLCIGVGKHANTKILFETADQLKCHYIYDQQIHSANMPQLLAQLQQFIDQVDYLYITVDLDVFAASIAPGVSAPAWRGITLGDFEQLFAWILRSGKVRILDIAECNPVFDIDQRTAKLAAYIIFEYLNTAVTHAAISGTVTT
ncbi:formimidoylglutamase [Acinetobacter larvae]|uniref:Formimidoylglutamase n=1 Tax=Acinetobacter larvae TaxID=1789224 RepID=A0A1B2LZZ7_9GAMM|nr:formimidoylglutamase [Acinetobacter larvae]AOA58363.1 formimidoylglutamase [Acinetobacter larvae]